MTETFPEGDVGGDQEGALGGSQASQPGAPQYAQGASWEGDDVDERKSVIEAAFDYRGNVTLGLRSGLIVEGYLSNRDFDADEPFIDIFPKGGAARRRLPCDDIQAISFTGKDTASGKSWETWVKKWNAKKEAEARGENVGDIGLYPDSLDE